jgi:hypothetical protein
VAAEKANLKLHEARLKREREAKENEEHLAEKELKYQTTNEFMTENPQTEVSMLAPHRFKPYHFKGFNQER